METLVFSARKNTINFKDTKLLDDFLVSAYNQTKIAAYRSAGRSQQLRWPAGKGNEYNTVQHT